jgi:imidazoleglycerol-phosphate dehydratase
MPESLPLGDPAFDPQLAEHAISSFATAANITLHVELVRGRNVHHIIEATFKGLARTLRDAVRVDDAGGVPSTKGVL